MCLEVKSNQKAYQKATKQLFDGKERLEEIFAAIGMTSEWKFVGVFYAHIAAELPLFDCANCCTFAIIGEEEIHKKLPKIEEEVMKKHENWIPEHHVEEFVELATQLLFIAQGDPCAPVTGSSTIEKTINDKCFNRIVSVIWLVIFYSNFFICLIRLLYLELIF